MAALTSSAAQRKRKDTRSQSYLAGVDFTNNVQCTRNVYSLLNSQAS